MRKKHESTADEIQFLKDNIAGRSYAELTALFNQRFGLELTSKQIGGLAYYRGLHNGLPNCSQPGHKAANALREGTEYIKPDGYVFVKTGKNTWVKKHRMIWEKAHGPVPKGHVITFADGNRQNFELDNLLLVSKSALSIMCLYGLLSADAELTRTGKAAADIRLLVTAYKSGGRKALKKRAAEIKAGGKA